MPEPDDISLLKQFAGGDESAFMALFERHVHLVYSTALRQVRNPSHAEEITQAVFILLARKAKSLSPKTILSGWLYQAARLTASSLIKREIRRQRREQEVYMQTLTEPETSQWEQIAPLLEEAMGRLGEQDRNAIVLRFFENKTPQEVAATLKLNEVTARKRVSRALEKLRMILAKRGIRLSDEAVAGAISFNSVQAAPTALANPATAIAIAKGAAASASTATLVKGALKVMAWTKAKIAIAVGAAAVIAGTGAFLVYHAQTEHAAAGSSALVDSSPVQINNSDFKPDGNQDGTFLVEADPKTLRTTNSAPAIYIAGPLAPDGSSILQSPVTADGNYTKTDNSGSTKYLVGQNSALYGKRVRITGWLKTRDVRGWASAFVMIMGADGRRFPYDDMSDRPIRGTTDWQQIEIITDLPDEPCVIYFGPDLYGPGELWGDNFQITPAPPGMGSTDDRNWRLTGETDPTVYSAETDYNVTHDGNAAVCFAYTPDGPAPRGTHMRYSHNFYGDDSGKYCGHTVRMSGWLKTENVSGRIYPVILPYAGWNKLLAKHSNASLNGTHDWTPFSVTCVVPEDTEYLRTGFDFYGSGKLWIDTHSLKFEIVK